MITAWMIYGIGILDGVKWFFAVMIFISALYLILIKFSTLQKKDMGETETDDEKKKRNRLVAKVFFSPCPVCSAFQHNPVNQTCRRNVCHPRHCQQ